MSPGEFYNAVYSTAIGLGANDVQARLAAAQASEETGYGQSMVGNNLFGVKAGSNYTGPSVTASTEEESNGVTSRQNANFRAYDNFTQSVKDYLGVVQQNFPDAWNATNFSDAVAGLKTGVYGSYATRAAYPKSITAIDKKYGGLQYAANPSNVPTPYGPNDPVPDVAVADDVLPMAEPNFQAPTPGFEYASNLSGVPVPEQRPAVPGFLTAFDEQQQVAAPFDKVLSPQGNQPGEWGVNNGVGPVYTPTVETWSDMAAAPVIKSPLGSVTAQGLLGANPALEASTKAGVPGGPSGIFEGIVTPGNIDLGRRQVATLPDGSMATVRSMSFQNNAGNEVLVPTISPTGDPLTDQQAKELYGTTGQHLGIFDSPANADKYAEALHLAQERYYAPSEVVPASGLLGTTPGFDAGATVGLLSQATPSERMGLSEPGFDTSRFDGFGPSVAEMDASRLASDPKTSRIGTTQTLGDMARMSPFAGAIDPATNTTSFRDQPADLGNMPEGYAAQRGPSTGIQSAEHQMRVADVMRQLQDPSLMAATPSLNVPASGLLAGVPGLEAQATANVPAQTSGLLGGVDQAAAAERPNSVITNPGTFAAPNFNQAMNPSVPAMSMPSVQMAQTPAVDPTTTGSTTPGLFTPGLLSNSRPTLTPASSKGILAEQPINQVGFLDSLQAPSNIDINLSGNIVPATQQQAVPALDTVQVSEQPTIAAPQDSVVEGPATTPAIQQQKQATEAVTPSDTVPSSVSRPQSKGILSGLLSKEAIGGGILGGLALGPVGGILGTLAGQQVARNGGLTGLLGGSSFSAPTTQIAGGMSNIAGLYSGAYSPGTFAVANNGATITAQPGGYSTYTNKYGVTEAIGPDGKISAYFGGADDPSNDATATGGMSGGGYG